MRSANAGGQMQEDKDFMPTTMAHLFYDADDEAFQSQLTQDT